ncbi:hypothetical protein [Litorivivens sp.]|uniref:hypothetical protein n=1 Tax=Litorivivens sp. TaxID=2020868 RepID=UPI003565F676
MTPSHWLSVAALSFGLLTASGCSTLPGTTAPSPELQAAITFIQAGEPTAALPILSSIANSDTAPETELVRARVLGAILQLERGEPDKARLLAEQLESDDPSIDLHLYQRALRLAIDNAAQAHKAHAHLQTCERSNDRLRDEKQSLEGTLKKLRKLSLE